MPETLQIIAAYLNQHNYDGLYLDDVCACTLEDGLAPCESITNDCTPGYTTKQNQDGFWVSKFNPNTVYLDTETTGLNLEGQDEILEITILDDEGNPVIDTLIKPAKLTTWKEAESIHGISPEMVKDAPTLDKLRPQIHAALKGKEVIIYNASYDLGFFTDDEFFKQPEFTAKCAMQIFSDIFKEPNTKSYGGQWKSQSLDKAAKHVSHTWQDKAHRSLADTQATRSVWHWCKQQIELGKA